MKDSAAISAELRAPRAGAIAGIVFSILLMVCLGYIRLSVPANPEDAVTWLSTSSNSLSLALSLLLFAGIAFLWFIGVLRDRMGVLEDRFFASVFLGSGILFLAMLFVASAIAGAIVMSYRFAAINLVSSGLYSFARSVAYVIINVYAIKMAGVFMISTSTLAIRTGIFPRGLALLGYALALFLILTSSFVYWAPLLFPIWILVISIYILRANLTR